MSRAQSPIYTITADSLQPDGTYNLSNLLWKYQPGDDPAWSGISYDDSNWSPVYTSLSSNIGPNVYWTGIGWFRINIRIDSNLVHAPLNLRISQYGASEIFLNGILIEKLGNISETPESEHNYVTFSSLSRDKYFTLPLKPDTVNVLAVRYAIHSLNNLHKMGVDGGFDIHLINMKQAVSGMIDTYRHHDSFKMLLIGIILAIFLLHLMLYIFYPDKKSNLFYAFLIGLYAFLNIIQVYSNNIHNLAEYILIIRLELIVLIFMTLAILQTGYVLLETKKLIKSDIIPILVGLVLIVLSWIYVINVRILVQLFLLTSLIVLSWRVILKFSNERKIDAYILGTGFLVTIVMVGIGVFTKYGLISHFPGSNEGLLTSFSTLGMILSMSVYLVKDIADTNKGLQEKIEEAHTLQ